MRPQCGKKHGGNRKSQGALARLCEFPGRFRFTALKGRNKVAPFRLGCSASLSRPQGALGFDPPLNPLSPAERRASSADDASPFFSTQNVNFSDVQCVLLLVFYAFET